MNPIKLTTRISKKAVWLGLAKMSFIGFGIYGMVAGYNNFTAFTVREYNQFIEEQAKARNIVEVKTETQYILDPAKAADAVTAAAAEGAKQGADASIKANLGK